MLYYNHIFNTNVDYPFHIHILDSDTSSIAVNLNGNFIGYYKPTKGSKYSFTKFNLLENSILELMVSGTRKNYDRKLTEAIFKDTNIRYIQNLAGKFLVRDNETNLYYWSDSDRTNFYFNPFYFASKFLWELTIGYVPSGETTFELFDDKSLFLPKNVILNEDWQNSIPIQVAEPIRPNYFSNNTAGYVKEYSVDYFINELQDLKDSDIISFSNGTETIEVKVENIYTQANYTADNETTRPIIHVPIDIINPNKKIIYSKSLEIGQEEIIHLDLYDNNIQFRIKRNAE